MCNVFISDLDAEVEYICSRFANDTEQGGAVGLLEGWNDHQNSLPTEPFYRHRHLQTGRDVANNVAMWCFNRKS